MSLECCMCGCEMCEALDAYYGDDLALQNTCRPCRDKLSKCASPCTMTMVQWGDVIEIDELHEPPIFNPRYTVVAWRDLGAYAGTGEIGNWVRIK